MSDENFDDKQIGDLLLHQLRSFWCDVDEELIRKALPSKNTSHWMLYQKMYWKINLIKPVNTMHYFIQIINLICRFFPPPVKIYDVTYKNKLLEFHLDYFG